MTYNCKKERQLMREREREREEESVGVYEKGIKKGK